MSEQIFQCEQCQQRYNLFFRRKKQCDLCGQIFCSKCLPKLLNNSRACSTCLLITNEHTTHDQLATIRIKHLRAYLIHSKIVSINRLESCFEKQDLINLIESKNRRIPGRNYAIFERTNTNNNTETINISNHQEFQQPIIVENEQTSSVNNGSSVISSEPRIETTVDPSPSPVKPQFNRITLGQLSSFESIHDLTVLQLKDILIQNFVSIKGCVEKNELINKVELLYRDQKKQQQQSNTTVSTEQSNENLCKICMDANIDCVFLDCGHLCTCVQCGKRLSECPLCRSYIIRVVRVFKS